MKSGPKLKVGLVFDDSLDSNDGVAQYVKTLGAWLTDQGHSVRYLVGETKMMSWHGGKVYSLAKNVKVNFNSNKLSVPLPANSKNIKRIIADEDFDVLHVMVPYSPMMAAKVIKLAPRNVVIVGTFHIFPSGWLSASGSRLLRMMLARTLRRFDKIMSVSPAAAQFANEAYRIRSEIVPNAVDIRKFQGISVKDGKIKKIVFLGRLVDRKGAKYLIQAFARLASSNVKLIIAGDGPQRSELEALATKLNLNDKLDFLGFIDEADKPSLLAQADIACFPSLYGESFGIVLIEAMAAGAKVVLAGDNPGYRSVLGDQPKLLVDPRRTDQFTARLKEMLTEKQTIGLINGWQLRAVKKYDINRVGRHIEDIYSGQIARPGKNSHNKAHG
jgi:phosphatidylinositol alpha-mannosyltransferase